MPTRRERYIESSWGFFARPSGLTQNDIRGGLRGCMSHAIRVILSSPIFGERRIPEALRAKTSFGSEWPTSSTEHLLQLAHIVQGRDRGEAAIDRR